MAGLLYGLVDITEKKKTGDLAPTDQPCKWNQPRNRKLSPKKAQYMIFRKCTTAGSGNTDEVQSEYPTFRPSGTEMPFLRIWHIKDTLSITTRYRVRWLLPGDSGATLVSRHEREHRSKEYHLKNISGRRRCCQNLHNLSGTFLCQKCSVAEYSARWTSRQCFIYIFETILSMGHLPLLGEIQ